MLQIDCRGWDMDGIREISEEATAIVQAKGDGDLDQCTW